MHGITAQAAYTWSHSLDEVTAYRGALPQDSTNFKGDYGNSDFDMHNIFVGLISYDVPGGQVEGPDERLAAEQPDDLPRRTAVLRLQLERHIGNR